MQKWEYLIVTADLERNYWRPRYVNSRELPDWRRGPTLDEFANELGEQGWELVAAPFTTGDAEFRGVAVARMIFKRPKE